MLVYRKTGSSFNGASLERVLSVNVFGHLEGVFLTKAPPYLRHERHAETCHVVVLKAVPRG